MSQAGIGVATAARNPGFGKAVGTFLLRFWRRYPSASVAVVVLIIVVLATIFANVISPFEPNKAYGVRLGGLLEPGKNFGIHLLGTDTLGRDLFTRVLVGGRVSLLIGLIAPTVGITIGALAGITGAYFGGLTDLIIQRITDTLMAIPSLVMAMAITISLGFTLPVVILAIAVGIAPYASRLLRSHALVLRSMQYIEASRAIGATNKRIILRHLVPNSWAPWIVMLAVNIGNAIVIEASLSYLGIGIAPPTSSWGNLLIRAASYFTDNPHLVYAPGLMITIVVLCSNIFGDALRDMLDPRLRGAD
jgi:peptide/nickel transport system permease protein